MWGGRTTTHTHKYMNRHTLARVPKQNIMIKYYITREDDFSGPVRRSAGTPCYVYYRYYYYTVVVVIIINNIIRDDCT